MASFPVLHDEVDGVFLVNEVVDGVFVINEGFDGVFISVNEELDGAFRFAKDISVVVILIHYPVHPRWNYLRIVFLVLNAFFF